MQKCAELGIGIAPHHQSWFLRIVGAILAFFGCSNFREYSWIILGDTIYYPASVIDPFDDVYRGILISRIRCITRNRRSGPVVQR